MSTSTGSASGGIQREVVRDPERRRGAPERLCPGLKCMKHQIVGRSQMRNEPGDTKIRQCSFVIIADFLE